MRVDWPWHDVNAPALRPRHFHGNVDARMVRVQASIRRIRPSVRLSVCTSVRPSVSHRPTRCCSALYMVRLTTNGISSNGEILARTAASYCLIICLSARLVTSFTFLVCSSTDSSVTFRFAAVFLCVLLSRRISGSQLSIMRS